MLGAVLSLLQRLSPQAHPHCTLFSPPKIRKEPQLGDWTGHRAAPHGRRIPLGRTFDTGEATRGSPAESLPATPPLPWSPLLIPCSSSLWGEA